MIDFIQLFINPPCMFQSLGYLFSEIAVQFINMNFFLTYINLQYVDFECDLSKIQNEFGVKLHNFDDLDHYNDLDNVAALCAALDLVVTTKITVPSISAAVGTTTKLANWRQSPWNNILVNPHLQSIDIYERNTWEPWHKVFSKIAKDIFKMKTKVKSR